MQLPTLVVGVCNKHSTLQRAMQSASLGWADDVGAQSARTILCMFYLKQRDGRSLGLLSQYLYYSIICVTHREREREINVDWEPNTKLLLLLVLVKWNGGSGSSTAAIERFVAEL
jgi:hypothetical protein